jgi:hypothetical protein
MLNLKAKMKRKMKFLIMVPKKQEEQMKEIKI